ncbi:XisI protein [candidate division KSB1 bacterium]|nr:XisI protein [candidate division KSB1 bacterium]
MAKVDQYRAYVQDLLKQYSRHKSAYGEDEVQTIFDTEHDHYQLVHTGWHNNHRLYGCIIHMDIKNDKIWIQYDGTEVGMANELVTLGVPKEDIVLAFHPPYKRPYSGFAVN